MALRSSFLRIRRFVEVTAVAIRDAKGKARHRIVVEHETGARETIVNSTEKTDALTVRRVR